MSRLPAVLLLLLVPSPGHADEPAPAVAQGTVIERQKRDANVSPLLLSRPPADRRSGPESSHPRSKRVREVRISCAGELKSKRGREEQ